MENKTDESKFVSMFGSATIDEKSLFGVRQPETYDETEDEQEESSVELG